MTATSLNLADMEVTVAPAHACGAKMAGRRVVSAFPLPPHTALMAQLMQHRRRASQHTDEETVCTAKETTGPVVRCLQDLDGVEGSLRLMAWTLGSKPLEKQLCTVLPETEFFIVLSLTKLSCSHADLTMIVVPANLAAPRSNGFDKKLHRPLEDMAQLEVTCQEEDGARQ